METSVCIAQKGTVEEVSAHRIKVRIQQETACGHCSARGICNLSDTSEKIIEINDHAPELKTGDPVEITITRNMGNMAVVLAYLFPFLLVISVLLLFNALGIKEWLTGVIALGSLVPYYFILYFFRDRLKKHFTFSVRKTK